MMTLPVVLYDYENCFLIFRKEKNMKCWGEYFDQREINKQGLGDMSAVPKIMTIVRLHIFVPYIEEHRT